MCGTEGLKGLNISVRVVRKETWGRVVETHEVLGVGRCFLSSILGMRLGKACSDNV